MYLLIEETFEDLRRQANEVIEELEESISNQRKFLKLANRLAVLTVKIDAFYRSHIDRYYQSVY